MLNSRIQLIAEVKTSSPFGWKSDKSWDELFEIANNVGDVLSIHTDPKWNGSFELIKKARSLTTKPILAKGIHATDEEVGQALAAGADFVLVVGRVPGQYLGKCWLEPVNLQELKTYPPDSKVVWNSRDLNDGSLKLETFTEARQLWQGWLCQASNITNMSDVDPLADAVLVGSHLPQFVESMQQNAQQ